MRAPLTKVPLALPRSSTVSEVSPWMQSRQWARLMAGLPGMTRSDFAGLLPTTVLGALSRTSEPPPRVGTSRQRASVVAAARRAGAATASRGRACSAGAADVPPKEGAASWAPRESASRRAASEPVRYSTERSIPASGLEVPKSVAHAVAQSSKTAWRDPRSPEAG